MMWICIALFCLLFNFSLEIGRQNVIFIIISQNEKHNFKLAERLQKGLKDQSFELNLKEPKIYLSNRDFNTSAAWTITPLILEILDSIEDTQWVIFLEDRTKTSLKLLLGALEEYDPEKEIWVGHASHDVDATIIHHFSFHEDPTFFKYPNLGSGMALSVPLLKKLKAQIEGRKALDFHIDPAHEFALFVYKNGDGVTIAHNDLFCTREGSNCATYPQTFQPCGTGDISTIFFAVKTCQKFHSDRIPVLQKTWYKNAKNIVLFSDLEDPIIPTKTLGVKNTEQGHCAKTIAILLHGKDIFNKDAKLQWVALVDDDTILSVPRIANLTTCYNNNPDPIILGERYRFGAQGFDYPTGGAGILINRAAVDLLAGECRCPRPDAPDDMILGACAQELGILLVHVPQMHQARPQDYAEGRLAPNDHITFHKHWMIDPVKTYVQWFAMDRESHKFTVNSNRKYEL